MNKRIIEENSSTRKYEQELQTLRSKNAKSMVYQKSKKRNAKKSNMTKVKIRTPIPSTDDSGDDTEILISGGKETEELDNPLLSFWPKKAKITCTSTTQDDKQNVATEKDDTDRSGNSFL